MLVIIVEFQILPEGRAAFLKSVIENARRSLAVEKGCRRFDICSDPVDANIIFLYEIYEDTDSFQEHLASRHYNTFDAEAQRWVTSKVVRNLSLLSG